MQKKILIILKKILLINILSLFVMIMKYLNICYLQNNYRYEVNGYLESIILKLPVISYQPNSRFERCSAVNLGLIKTFKNFIDLKRIISGEKKISIKKKFKFY